MLITLYCYAMKFGSLYTIIININRHYKRPSALNSWISIRVTFTRFARGMTSWLFHRWFLLCCIPVLVIRGEALIRYIQRETKVQFKIQ